MSALNVTRHHR